MRAALIAAASAVTLAATACGGQPASRTDSPAEPALLLTPAKGTADDPRFRYEVERVTRSDLPHSWREGCPVGPKKLRLMRIRFHGFDHEPHMGRLVVHRSVTDEMATVFKRLYNMGFHIRKMKKVDAYDGDDDRSMRADNTSAFNCRFVSGTTRWSMHAYGKAIDVNPVENPYVTSSGRVSPPNGEEFADRSQQHKGMIKRGGRIVDAFDDQGWEWGGNWSNSKDYQHFSTNGT